MAPRYLLVAFAVSLAAPAGDARASMLSRPTAGSAVQRSVGGAVQYAGTVEGHPDLCWVQRGDARMSKFWFGVWNLEWPGADDFGAGMRKVLNGPPGTAVTFDTQSAPGMQWHDTLRNRGFEELNVLDGPRHTLRVEHEREGFGGNTYHSIITQWREVATGMTIYQNYQHISGHPEPGTSWDPLSERVGP